MFQQTVFSSHLFRCNNFWNIFLKVTFFNYVPNILVYCSNPSHFHQKAEFSNILTLETLARHSEKHFLMTVRIEKTRIFKNILKSKKSSSEKYFWNFRGRKFLKYRKSGNFRKSENRLFIGNWNFRDFLEKFQKIDPRNFQKYFSDEGFFASKYF